MSKKRSADNLDTPYSHFNPNVSSFQFQFYVDSPVAPSPASSRPAPEPTTPTPSRPHKKPRTSSAGSSSSADQTPTVRNYTTRINKTKAVMKLLTEDDRYRPGDFLGDIFDPETYHKLPEEARNAIKSWLKASARHGQYPAQVVDAIYRHPAGLAGSRDSGGAVRRALFSNLSVPAYAPGVASTQPEKVSLLPDKNGLQKLPPQQVNSREGLEELMVRGTLHLAVAHDHSGAKKYV